MKQRPFVPTTFASPYAPPLYRTFSRRRREGAGFVLGMLSALATVGALLWIAIHLHLPTVVAPSSEMLLDIAIACVTVGGLLLLALRQRQAWAWGLWVIVTTGMIYILFLK